MVQVDVVWSYAFGASLAAAGARQLEKEGSPFQNKHFTYALLFLSCLFAPTGLYLLWEFPHWETMQVAKSWGDIPSLLVLGFGITNITQGILGYWVSYHLARKGKYYASHVNWMVAWAVFWFILMCGWDGSGWQRFLYDPSMNNGELWAPGKHMGFGFFVSNVWIAIECMALFILPALYAPMVKWAREGAANDSSINNKDIPGPVAMTLAAFFGMWGGALAIAFGGAVTVIHTAKFTGNIAIGFFIALPLYCVATYFLLFRKSMPMYKIAKVLFVKEKNEILSDKKETVNLGNGSLSKA